MKFLLNSSVANALLPEMMQRQLTAADKIYNKYLQELIIKILHNYLGSLHLNILSCFLRTKIKFPGEFYKTGARQRTRINKKNAMYFQILIYYIQIPLKKHSQQYVYKEKLLSLR